MLRNCIYKLFVRSIVLFKVDQPAKASSRSKNPLLQDLFEGFLPDLMKAQPSGTAVQRRARQRKATGRPGGLLTELEGLRKLCDADLKLNSGKEGTGSPDSPPSFSIGPPTWFTPQLAPSHGPRRSKFSIGPALNRVEWLEALTYHRRWHLIILLVYLLPSVSFGGRRDQASRVFIMIFRVPLRHP